MSKEDDALLEGLTQEERDALAAPDDEDTSATQGELEDAAPATKDDDAEDTKPEGKDDSGNGDGAAADKPATTAAKADEPTPAPAAAAEPGAAQSAPVFVATAPADAEAKLAEIATKKADLRQKYDEGEITFDQYDSEKDTLAKQERDIERAVDKATLAAEMAEQGRRNDWVATANKFAADNGYAANPRLYRALDQEVRDVAGTEEGRAMNGPQILAKAHANLLEAGIAPKTAAEPAKTGAKAPPKPELPPDIGKLPAAGGNDPGEGRWATLDRLSSKGGEAYEKALAALSEADRDAYLAA